MGDVVLAHGGIADEEEARAVLAQLAATLRIAITDGREVFIGERCGWWLTPGGAVAVNQWLRRAEAFLSDHEPAPLQDQSVGDEGNAVRQVRAMLRAALRRTPTPREVRRAAAVL